MRWGSSFLVCEAGEKGDGQNRGKRGKGFGRMGWKGDKATYQSGFYQLPVGGVLAGLSGQCTPPRCAGTRAQDTQGHSRLFLMGGCSQGLRSSLLSLGPRKC